MEPGVLIALAVVAVVAFVAGWLARGRAERDQQASAAASDGPPPRVEARSRRGAEAEHASGVTAAPGRHRRGGDGGVAAAAASTAGRRVEARALDASPAAEDRPSAPDPGAAALRLLDQAASAFEAAVDRWLDEGDAITPAGRAALGELDRAIQRVDVAASRTADGTEARFSALDALDALRQGASLLQPYREGRSLDAATSRSLDAVEAELQSARDGLAGAVAH